MAIFDYNPSAITPFPYWKWNKVLPAVYDDSVSQYEMLCKLLSVVNNIIESTNSTGEQVEALTQLVQQLIDGGFPSGLVEYVNDIVDAAMADDIEAMTTAINNIKTAVDTNSLSGKTCVVYGDSTMVDVSDGNPSVITYIEQYTGMTVINRAAGGTSVSNLITLLNSATSADFDGVDFVLFAYCTNDWQGSVPLWDTNGSDSNSTFEKRLYTAFNRFFAISGDSRPVFITPAYGHNDIMASLAGHAINTNLVGASLADYVNVANYVCHNLNIPCIDLFNTMGINEQNYGYFMNRSSQDTSASGYNIFVHYNNALKQKVADIIKREYPFNVPAYPFDDCSPSSLDIGANTNIHSVNANRMSSAFSYSVPFRTFIDGANNIRVAGVFTGNDTLSFINNGNDSLAVQIGVTNPVRYSVTKSGYITLNVKGFYGEQNVYFYTTNSREVHVCNPHLSCGCTKFNVEPAATGFYNGFKHPNDGHITNIQSANRIYIGFIDTMAIVFFNEAVVSNTVAANGNVMILAHMGDAMVSQRWVNLNVFNPSTSQWTVEKFYLANPSTGDYAYLRPYATLPANSRISGTIVMPIIRSLATNEQWS